MVRKEVENPFGLKDVKGNIRMMSKYLTWLYFPARRVGRWNISLQQKPWPLAKFLQMNLLCMPKQIIANAQAMANALRNKNYNSISDGTDNHLLLIDLRNKNISGKKAEQVLGKADITVNKNMVPFDDKSAFVTSGIRIGVPAVTSRGMKEEHMQFIVDSIDDCLTHADDVAHLSNIKKKVNEFMQQFPLYPELD
jgi:glycine hydroxymethyltransferase